MLVVKVLQFIRKANIAKNMDGLKGMAFLESSRGIVFPRKSLSQKVNGL